MENNLTIKLNTLVETKTNEILDIGQNAGKWNNYAYPISDGLPILIKDLPVLKPFV
jgi:uncharacterized protein YbaR (Trm112 family)